MLVQIMTTDPQPGALGDADVRTELGWLMRQRRVEFWIGVPWAGALVGAMYWQSGPGLITHAFAVFAVAAFVVGAVLLAVRERRELADAGDSVSAARAVLRTQLELRVGNFRTTEGVRVGLKMGGVLLVLIAVVNVVKEYALGYGWDGLPMLATMSLYGLLFTVWPMLQKRSLLPRLERDLAALDT